LAFFFCPWTFAVRIRKKVCIHDLSSTTTVNERDFNRPSSSHSCFQQLEWVEGENEKASEIQSFNMGRFTLFRCGLGVLPISNVQVFLKRTPPSVLSPVAIWSNTRSFDFLPTFEGSRPIGPIRMYSCIYRLQNTAVEDKDRKGKRLRIRTLWTAYWHIGMHEVQYSTG